MSDSQCDTPQTDKESVELSHQKVLMQMVEKFHLITVFKIKKNKPKDFLLFRLLLCKVEKSVCCEKIGGEGVAQ